MQLIDSTYADLRLLDKQLELVEQQALDSRADELLEEGSSSNALPAARPGKSTSKRRQMGVRRASSGHISYHSALTTHGPRGKDRGRWFVARSSGCSYGFSCRPVGCCTCSGAAHVRWGKGHRLCFLSTEVGGWVAGLGL